MVVVVETTETVRPGLCYSYVPAATASACTCASACAAAGP